MGQSYYHAVSEGTSFLYVSAPYSQKILPPKYPNKLLKLMKRVIMHFEKSRCYAALESLTIQMKHNLDLSFLFF